MKRIVFYGDSNTFGYDPQAFMGGRYSEDVRWTDILAKRFAGRFEIIARGMNGRTIPTGDYGLDAVEKMIKGMQPIDYFAIMLGTNDILLTDRPDWEEAVRNMEALIDRVRSIFDDESDDRCDDAQNMQIILISPPILFPGSQANSPFKQYEDHSIKLAEAYRELAKKKNLISVSADKWNVDLAYDMVHLSPKGSLEFADHMADFLGTVL